MPDQMYMIAFDILDSVDVTKAVKAFIKSSEDFPHWWNYIPGVFLVTSELTSEEISDQIRCVSGDASFIVLEVEPRNSQGWLPEKSWEWIKRREREHVENKVVTPN